MQPSYYEGSQESLPLVSAAPVRHKKRGALGLPVFYARCPPVTHSQRLGYAETMANNKTLLIVAHVPSPNTRLLAEKATAGARHPDIEAVTTLCQNPFETTPDDVLACDGIIMGTTENLGYMSGALKDFFDRIYYPCLEEKQGLPCALYIRAGRDGTGTKRAVESIVTGLKWNWVRPPLILQGEFREEFADQCEELGMLMAASLDTGIV